MRDLKVFRVEQSATNVAGDFLSEEFLLFFAPAQCGLTISKMLRHEMRCHQPGISNRILSVLLHETFRPIAAWIQSCKLPQPFTRLSIYVKLPKLSQQTFGREEIVLIKVDAFWQKTNLPKLNQSSDDFESYLVLRDTKVAKRLSRNLSAFAITTTQWTPLLFCVGAIRKKNDIHTCVLLTPCLLADDMLTFLCFFLNELNFRYGSVTLFHCCEEMPVSLFFTNNGSNDERHYEALMRPSFFFVHLFITFMLLFIKRMIASSKNRFSGQKIITKNGRV